MVRCCLDRGELYFISGSRLATKDLLDDIFPSNSDRTDLVLDERSSLNVISYSGTSIRLEGAIVWYMIARLYTFLIVFKEPVIEGWAGAWSMKRHCYSLLEFTEYR